MPTNIENLLQFIDQDDDYLDGLDLVAAGAPLAEYDEDAVLDDQVLADLDEL
ncbi:MAG: hypothetical protein AAF346_20515 [Pseudomonadota bacterium]